MHYASTDIGPQRNFYGSQIVITVYFETPDLEEFRRFQRDPDALRARLEAQFPDCFGDLCSMSTYLSGAIMIGPAVEAVIAGGEDSAKAFGQQVFAVMQKAFNEF